MIGTYNGRWPKTNERTYGGYADVWSGHYNFVFKIPDNLPNEVAATFFCAGITTYAPMKRHGINSESTVGVIGIGKCCRSHICESMLNIDALYYRWFGSLCRKYRCLPITIIVVAHFSVLDTMG